MSRSLGRSAFHWFMFGLLALLLGGCGGDDGDDGTDGEDAIIGQRTVAPERLFVDITKATVSSPIQIEFQVTDERGLPVSGIEDGVSFTVNKLVPGSAGANSRWQSYILSDDEGTPNAQPGTYGDGTLEDLGRGRYRFTFADELEDIDSVGFEPSLTHRVGVELRDVVIVGEELNGSSNGVLDFQPSSGATNVDSKHIVTNESCATCHGGPPPFNFHGGPRNDVEYCVTCHQPGAIDAGTGNSIDMADMIHKIHNGSPNAQYCGFGCENFGAPVDDFSDVVHPQDVRNCTTCHDPDNPETPQADVVNNGATAVVCASCHENLAFDANGLTNAGGNHPPGAALNTECATCHADGGLVGGILDSHAIPEKVAAARFEYNIVSVTQTGQNQSPLVTFSVTDPTNGDAPYSLASDDAFTGDGARFVMVIAWPTSDYTNVDTGGSGSVIGSAPARPFEIDLLQGVGGKITDNGDGTYTVNTSVDTSGSGGEAGFSIPSGATGSGGVAIEGHMAGDFDDPATPGNEQDGTFDQEIPVTSVVEFFAITDPSPSARRSVVDIEKCQDCHGENDGLALHGGNRVDNIDHCVMCHNPNATDIAQRPADPDSTVNGENTAAPDNLEERTIDMKFMIHAIHGADVRDSTKGYQVRGFFNSDHDYSDAHYPRSAADCLACHEEGTFELPVDGDVLATTIETQATVNTASNFGTSDFVEASAGAAGDPSDDSNQSPAGAVCYSCHNSDSARDHMAGTAGDPTGFGNSLLRDPGDPAAVTGSNPHLQSGVDAQPENCAFCHGSGAIVDVAEVHSEAAE